MPFTSAQLPSLPLAGVAGPASASAPQGSLRSSKRRLSNATVYSLNDDDSDDEDGMDDDHEDQSHQPATRSKRSRPSFGAAGAPPQGSPKQQQQAIQPGKALTEKEKEARRVARMIRNRNAAQASRDRKKEHTAFLERRVAELEAQLRAQAVAPLPTSSVGGSTASSSASSSSSGRHSRSTRETSVVSSTGSASSSGRIADLEDENDGLRSQLHLEQVEKAELRARLVAVEDKLASLSSLIHPSAALAGLSSPPLFATTLTPLPRYAEPTFAFDTPNLNPLPQPEERAYLEEREREKLSRRRALSVGQSALGLTTSTPAGSPSASATTTTTRSQSKTDNLEIEKTSQDVAAAAAPLDSLRLVAAEAVVGVAAPAAASSNPGLSPSSSLSSLSPSVSPAALPVLLPPFDFDNPTTGGSSTPPALPESYLDLDEPVDVNEVWTTWAKGSLPASAASKSKVDPHHGDDEALAYLDLSFLQDAPVAAAC